MQQIMPVEVRAQGHDACRALARSWMLEAIANMPPIEHVRRNFSDAHRAKLAAAKKGNSNAAGALRSDETRAKLSTSLRGNTNAARSKPKIKRAGWHDLSSSSSVDPDFDDMPELNTNKDW